MTTSRTNIRRERIHNWPIFKEFNLSDQLLALSVEITKCSHEKVGVAVAEASQALTSALLASTFRHIHLFLVARGSTLEEPHRVAAYVAERHKLWNSMERSGLPIPIGPLSERRVDYDDGKFGFIGTIDFALAELPVALEVTRREDAVCIAADPGGCDSLIDEISASYPGGSLGSTSVLGASVRHLADYEFVARAFGQFDDRVVGAEIFGRQDSLDSLAKLLQ
jgi:hypothetical protein